MSGWGKINELGFLGSGRALARLVLRFGRVRLNSKTRFQFSVFRFKVFPLGGGSASGGRLRAFRPFFFDGFLYRVKDCLKPGV